MLGLLRIMSVSASAFVPFMSSPVVLPFVPLVATAAVKDKRPSEK